MVNTPKRFVTKGQRFGQLTVTDARPSYVRAGGVRLVRACEVRCSCGTVKRVAIANLLRNVSPVISCGCARRAMLGELASARAAARPPRDGRGVRVPGTARPAPPPRPARPAAQRPKPRPSVRVGQQSGQLTVTNTDPDLRTTNGSRAAEVSCTCGVVRLVAITSLVRAAYPITSCGCARRTRLGELMKARAAARPPQPPRDGRGIRMARPAAKPRPAPGPRPAAAKPAAPARPRPAPAAEPPPRRIVPLTPPPRGLWPAGECPPPPARNVPPSPDRPKCPATGCPVRYRGGPDRACPLHQEPELRPSLFATRPPGQPEDQDHKPEPPRPPRPRRLQLFPGEPLRGLQVVRPAPSPGMNANPLTHGQLPGRRGMLCHARLTTTSPVTGRPIDCPGCLAVVAARSGYVVDSVDATRTADAEPLTAGRQA